MKNDLERYVRFYNDIQQIERCLRHATDLANELDIDAVLADKMEMARQEIEDHVDRKFGGKPAIWETGGFQHSEEYPENQDQLLCRSIK